MSSIAVTASATGAGVITLAAPITATNRTITLPDATGTLLSTATPGVPIDGPAFGAFASTATTLSSGASTKITLNSEFFDTNNNFTNSRFTPTVAGYYQINGVVSYTTVANSSNWVAIQKNGVEYGRWSRALLAGGLAYNGVCSSVVYLNGSTDYVELYVFTNGGNITTDTTQNQFSGFLARSAT